MDIGEEKLNYTIVGSIVAALGLGYWYWQNNNADAGVVPPSSGSIAPVGTYYIGNPVAIQINNALKANLNVSGLNSILPNYGYASGTLMNVSQWNYVVTDVFKIPGQLLGDSGNNMPAGEYISLLTQWANNNL